MSRILSPYQKKSLLAVVFYLTVTVIYLTEELSENESNLNSWILTILLIHGLSWQYCKWQVKITCAGNSNKMNRIPYLEYCWLGSLSIIKNVIIDSTEKLNLTEHINDINNTLLLITSKGKCRVNNKLYRKLKWIAYRAWIHAWILFHHLNSNLVKMHLPNSA